MENLKHSNWLKTLEQMNHKRLRTPLFFLLFGLLSFSLSGVSSQYISRELLIRFIRNAVMVMALIIPLRSGMGINFSVVVGAMCSQGVMIFLVDRKQQGPLGLVLFFVLTVAVCAGVGWIIGKLMNRGKGFEMILGIIISYIATNLYQIIFMVGYGLIFEAHSPEILLSRSIGVRNMIDIMSLKSLFIQGIYTHLLLIALIGVLIAYLGKSVFGKYALAVIESQEKALHLGISGDHVRILSIMISTVLAGIGHGMYMLELGSVNVYTGYLNVEVFAAASLLAGGASLIQAGILNALVGTLLFHNLFILTPILGQNLFQSSAIGEYFRSFIAYGTILMGFLINTHNQKE